MKTLIIFALVMVTSSVQAFDINKYISKKDIKTLRYGAATSVGFFKPAEPDGDTSMVGDFVMFNGIATMRYKKNSQRFWADVSYQYFETDATTSEIGQQVGRYKALVSFQKYMNIAGQKMWLGGGGGMIIEQADSRHTIDELGYLKEDLGARTTVDLMGVGSAQMALLKFRAGIPVELGVHAQIELALQTMAPSFVFGADFMF